MALTRGKKILIGCLAVAGAALMAVVVAVILFFVWLQSPGEILRGARLVDEATGCYVEASLLREDPAARDLVRALLQAQRQPISRDELDNAPPWLQWLVPKIQGLANREVTDEEIDEILPLRVILTTEADAEGLPAILFIVNAPPTGNTMRVIDTVFSWTSRWSDEIDGRSRGGENYYRFVDPDASDSATPVWVSFVQNNALISTAETPLIGGIDRLRRPPEVAPQGTVADLLRALPEESVLRLAAAPGEFAVLLDVLEQVAPDSSQMLRLYLGGEGSVSAWARLESPDVLVGQITGSATETGGPPSLSGGGPSTFEIRKGEIRVRLEPVSSMPGSWSLRAEGIEGMLTAAAAAAQSRNGVRVRTDIDIR